jgi:transaldolase
MKFFIDSTNIEDIGEINELGLVDGVTTNPSLISSSGKNYEVILSEICKLVKGPVSAEVVAEDSKNMVAEGLALCKISSNIVVKLPCTWDGIRACNILSNKKIKTNLTLCFSASQALLAAKAGASFISPFVGRLDDISQNGLHLVKEIFTIFNQYANIDTEILVASVRSPIHIIEAAKIGADVATMAPKILRQLVEHPLTDKGLEIFKKDWQKTGQKIKI